MHSSERFKVSFFTFRSLIPLEWGMGQGSCLLLFSGWIASGPSRHIWQSVFSAVCALAAAACQVPYRHDSQGKPTTPKLQWLNKSLLPGLESSNRGRVDAQQSRRVQSRQGLRGPDSVYLCFCPNLGFSGDLSLQLVCGGTWGVHGKMLRVRTGSAVNHFCLESLSWNSAT